MQEMEAVVAESDTASVEPAVAGYAVATASRSPASRDGPSSAASDLARLLREHAVFAALTPEQFAPLLAATRAEDAESGRVFYHRGEFARHFFMVVEGRVNLCVVSRSGEDKIIELLGPGRIFGEVGMFNAHGSYPVTAVAATRVRVARIANRDYLAQLRQSPEACLSMLYHLAERLGRHVQQIEFATLEPATDRLVRLLESRMPVEGEGPFDVRLDETRQELASFLSMKPETLSRALRSLAASGAIVVRGREVRVASRERLLSHLSAALQ
jgi:CRP-like cAMP-binding protein